VHPSTEGGLTRQLASGEQMTIFDAARRYAAHGVPLLAIPNREYGSGASRDWAAGPTLDGTVEFARPVCDAQARAYGIDGDNCFGQVCHRALPGPPLLEWLGPIGPIVTRQLLTEMPARRLGFDPDRPRGLNKVTQTDQGQRP
jgi:aconitase family protein (aconitate hydratase)